ncbi:MAG: nucleoside-diphosphate kinase [Spirochaetales bacterium]|nr:nucleoside-diphosphate kinase [Spirochaetales bacterium]
MIKPDGVRRALVGRILTRFEEAGLTLKAMTMTQATPQQASAHYAEHEGKSFHPPLVQLLTSGPVVLLALEGAHAIEVVRKIVGATEPREAAPGSIRGDFCHMGYARSKERLGVIPNLIHASDSEESAKRELSLWFKDVDNLPEYQRVDMDYL